MINMRLVLETIEFDHFLTINYIKQQLGAKNYKKIVDDALKLKNNLLLDLDTKIDPKGVIEG